MCLSEENIEGMRICECQNRLALPVVMSSGKNEGMKIFKSLKIGWYVPMGLSEGNIEEIRICGSVKIGWHCRWV